MAITFYRNHIHFSDYTFSIASVNNQSKLSAQDIREVHTLHRAPPEIVTVNSEILFIPAELASHLRLFTEINTIPDTHPVDVWDLLLEPFLDTEHSLTHQQQTIKLLNKCGFSTQEVADIRRIVEDKVSQYNAVLWEWVHLGHYDLLLAYGFADLGESDLTEIQRDFYDWANQIALRGIPQERETSTTVQRANFKIDQLMMDLASTFGIESSEEISQQIKPSLLHAYTQTHRHYHNLTHILKVLALCHSAELETEDRLALHLAVWFHDIVYDPTASDNEEQSAELMAEILEPLYLPQNLIEKSQALILATKSHLQASDDLTQRLVDADLAIFSATEQDYKQYTMGIRTEYTHVPDEIFYPARLAFLEQLHQYIQSNGKLYHSLHPIHEQMAQENIQREITAIYKQIE